MSWSQAFMSSPFTVIDVIRARRFCRYFGMALADRTSPFVDASSRSALVSSHQAFPVPSSCMTKGSAIQTVIPTLNSLIGLSATMTNSSSPSVFLAQTVLLSSLIPMSRIIDPTMDRRSWSGVRSSLKLRRYLVMSERLLARIMDSIPWIAMRFSAAPSRAFLFSVR